MGAALGHPFDAANCPFDGHVVQHVAGAPTKHKNVGVPRLVDHSDGSVISAGRPTALGHERVANEVFWTAPPGICIAAEPNLVRNTVREG